MKITLATKITIARIFLIIPTIAMFIAAELARVSQGAHIALIVIAAALFAICCATDFVDGHIARKTNTVSMLGKFLDPLADKVVIVVMLFLIVLFRDGLSMNGVYPHNALVIALLSGLILSRELMIGVFLHCGVQRFGACGGHLRQNQNRVSGRRSYDTYACGASPRTRLDRHDNLLYRRILCGVQRT